MINYKNRVPHLGVHLLLLFIVTTVTAVDAACESLPMVQVEGRRLSIRASRAPLEMLLAKVSQKSGIEIFFQGLPEETITIQMDQVEMERGMKRLTRGRNHAFTYGYNKRNEVVINQLHIYSKSGLGDMVRIMPAAINGAVRQIAGKTDTGIVIYPETPSGKDRLLTMQAIDPLMKINQVKAPYLPANFHGEGDD